MAGQVSPGIVLRERDLTAQTIINQQANTAALVGSFEKGPVGVITSIATERELFNTFGAPNNNNYEDWFTASTFLSYGGQLQIVRIADDPLKNGTTEVGTPTTDATKLNVLNAVGFTSGDYVKVDNEFFVIGTVTTGGSDSLVVTSRGQLGSTGSPVTHANGATTTKWSLIETATSSGILTEPDANPELSTTETFISVTSVTGFAAGDYVKIKRVPVGGTGPVTTFEYALITSIDTEANIFEVVRGQLGTPAITFNDEVTAGVESTVTVTVFKMTFESTATTTTLTTAFPNVTTAGATAPLIKSYDDYLANYSGYAWKFAARTAGTWANNIKVVMIDATITGTSYDTATLYGSTLWSTIALAPGTSTYAASRIPAQSNDQMHIVVLDATNNVLESFAYVSRLAGARDEQGASTYYVDVIAAKSSYIYAGTVAPAAGNQTLTFSAGVDAWTTDTGKISTAYTLFADIETVSTDFILCGGSLPVEANQKTKAQKAMEIASSRKDCIAFVSPWKGFVSQTAPATQRESIISFFSGFGSNSYAIFDSGYKYMRDEYNDTYRYIPCCADIAGLCVQISETAEDWISPAGVNKGGIKNAVKLAYTPGKLDRDKLYQNRINPITTFPGQGTVLFGDKTAMSTPSAFDRINVRRLFLAVEKKISELGKSVLFELNDSATRASFSSAANSYLAEVKSKRGVTDYLIVCDETNNTADVIDRNEFVAEVYMKPSRSINYITITFVATRSGVSFTEITG